MQSTPLPTAGSGATLHRDLSRSGRIRLGPRPQQLPLPKPETTSDYSEEALYIANHSGKPNEFAFLS